MKVLIIGAGFHNMGAEAMLVTLSKHLRRRFPRATPYHVCRNPTWRRRFEQIGVTPIADDRGYVSRKHRWPEFAKGLLSLPLPKKGYLPAGLWRQFDAVLDISGFAWGDQWSAEMAMNGWWRSWQLQSLGIPFVFLPQAWGPFHDPRVHLCTKLALGGADMVYARDETSYAHLHRLGTLPGDRLRLAADIAFHFEPSSPQVGHGILSDLEVLPGTRCLVGIAPNMRVYDRFAGEGAENGYVRLLIDICRTFIRQTDCNLVVVPHEVREGATHDDCYIARLLDQAVDSDRLHTVQRAHTAAEIKSLIGHFHFLVASRYHTLIAALSLRVPAIALGWSHKYRELLRSVDLEEYALGLVQMNSQAPHVALRGWTNRDALRQKLIRHVARLEASSRSVLEGTFDLLEARCRSTS